MINDVSLRVVAHSITTVDTAIGVGIGLGVAARDENKPHGSLVRNCKFFGESEVDDCPDEENGQCTTIRKAGLVGSIHNLSAHLHGNLEIHATKEMHLPLSA